MRRAGSIVCWYVFAAVIPTNHVVSNVTYRGAAQLLPRTSLSDKFSKHAFTNFTITFDPHRPDVAHARTTLHAICGTDKHDLGRTFQEGGYYYWSFRKVGPCIGADGERGSDAAKWKISYLFLDVNWTSGDSLGLNEPGAAD
jgi:hypothetical protein